MPDWARRLEERLLTGTPATIDRYWADPAWLMADAGYRPDPWQAALLRSAASRLLLLCCRQSGKSTVAAALALLTAVLEPPALILLLSPTERQSGELFRKVLDLFRALGSPATVANQSALQVEFANGSRVIALPGKEETTRCYSGVSLLVLDEAARVPDNLYRSVRPMLAVSKGRMIALSTPFGKRGWFFEAWAGNEPWERIRIAAQECPRITPEFLAEEQRALGPRWFAQEYQCSFEDAVGAVFAHEDIHAAVSSSVKPLALG
jgi:hypothetical protein